LHAKHISKKKALNNLFQGLSSFLKALKSYFFLAAFFLAFFAGFLAAFFFLTAIFASF